MNVEEILFSAAEKGASDIFLSTEKVPAVRIRSAIERLPEFGKMSKEQLDDFRNRILPADIKEKYRKCSGADAALEYKSLRFRLNFYETFTGPAVAARPVKSGDSCTFEKYDIPVKVFSDLGKLQRGLVLITGSTGSGKSTTLSALVNYINSTRAAHILTLEDPVEYIHSDNISVVSQREITNIEGGMQTALRNALRENPDVIVVGEMRDVETISTAITAAMTGHLVLATMHTLDTTSTVERIVSIFPENRRDQIAGSIAIALEAIVSQRLIPRANGKGMIPAFEIMLGTEILRKYVEKQNFGEIERCLKAYEHLGMCTFNAYLHNLCKRGVITFESAEEYSDNKDELRLMYSGITNGTAQGINNVYSGIAVHSGEVDMYDLFRAAVRANASDLLVTGGVPPMLKVAGEFAPLALPALNGNDTQHLIHSLMNRRQRISLEENRNLDFAVSVNIPLKDGTGSESRRFRLNAFFQQGELAIAGRLLANTIPTPQELGLPDIILSLIEKKQGLLLITGPTGSGKSTTLATLIDHLNKNHNRHIVTLEDPVEYIHTNDHCIIEQRELGRDTLSFSDGLRSAMRQAPDIIMVGEMRDSETIAAALTAAETGHLVLGTLHSNNTMQTVERIIDSFPEGKQNQVRQQFAATVIGVVAQRLIPRKDMPGKRIAAFEIMVGTYATRALIRDKKTHQLISTIESSHKDGMISMQRYLENLIEQDIIDPEVAKNFNTGS